MISARVLSYLSASGVTVTSCLALLAGRLPASVPAMYGGVSMVGPIGATIVFLLAMSLLASMLLTYVAINRSSRSPASIAAALCIPAAMTCNGVGDLWSINPVRWAVIPLQIVGTTTAYLVIRRHRRPAPVSTDAADVLHEREPGNNNAIGAAGIYPSHGSDHRSANG